MELPCRCYLVINLRQDISPLLGVPGLDNNNLDEAGECNGNVFHDDDNRRTRDNGFGDDR